MVKEYALRSSREGELASPLRSSLRGDLYRMGHCLGELNHTNIGVTTLKNLRSCQVISE